MIGEVESLRTELRAEGLDRVVLAGMGGSSLAPEVIASTEKVALTVLDTTDPGQVADALAGDLERTVLVVSSKSGTTVETDSHRRIFAEAFADAGIDAASRMIVVTDPGSPLAELASAEGYRRVFLADPHVGGRYSALSAFGLVPAGLAGADVARLLDQAASVAGQLSTDSPDNPALRLAAALGAAHAGGAEKVVLADTGSGITGFGDWAEQLIAESTGKQGTGLLPVVVESPDAPGFADAGADATPVAVGPATGASAVAVTGSLGAQFLLWEYAVAVVGRLLRINPFDQPDVEAAKKAARALLDNPQALTSTEEPAAVIEPRRGVRAGGQSEDGHAHGRAARVRQRCRRPAATSRYRRIWTDSTTPPPPCFAANSPDGRASRRRSGGGRVSCTPQASTTKVATPNGELFADHRGRTRRTCPCRAAPTPLGTLQLATGRWGTARCWPGRAGLCFGCT